MFVFTNLADSSKGSGIRFSSATSFPIGSPIYHNGSNYVLAQSNTETSCVQFVITKKLGTGPYSYTAMTNGEISLSSGEWSLINEEASALEAGKQYYLSGTTPGKISKIPGTILSPVLKAITSTSAFISFSINTLEVGLSNSQFRDTIVTSSIVSFVDLTNIPASKSHIYSLSVNGVVQSGNSFSLAGTRITFASSVASGSVIDCVYSSLQVVSDLSSYNKLVPFSETPTSPKSVFNLPSLPSGVNSLMVFAGGALQEPGVDYSLSGNLLTFSTLVPTGLKVSGFILNSSGTYEMGPYMKRSTLLLNTNTSATLTSVFGNQESALYRFFDINDPRTCGTISLKFVSLTSDPLVRVDTNSSLISLIKDTSLKLNVYIENYLLTFQNKTASSVDLRIIKEI